MTLLIAKFPFSLTQWLCLNRPCPPPLLALGESGYTDSSWFANVCDSNWSSGSNVAAVMRDVNDDHGFYATRGTKLYRTDPYRSVNGAARCSLRQHSDPLKLSGILVIEVPRHCRW